MSDHAPETPIASRAARALALREALDERRLIPPDYIENFTRVASEEWSPRNGARVVAKAWTDPAFRERLLSDATAACAELGYAGPQRDHVLPLGTGVAELGAGRRRIG